MKEDMGELKGLQIWELERLLRGVGSDKTYIQNQPRERLSITINKVKCGCTVERALWMSDIPNVLLLLVYY